MKEKLISLLADIGKESGFTDSNIDMHDYIQSVRCKNCKHWDNSVFGKDPTDGDCNHPRLFMDLPVPACFFCALFEEKA